MDQTRLHLPDGAAFRGVIDAVPHPIFVKDQETRFVIVNEMMCHLMGRTFDELIGRRDHDFFPKEQADVFRGNDLRVLNTGEINENEELFSDRDGNVRTIVTRKKRLVLANGARLLVGCITDISDFRRAEALMRYHADHDALTGLANRRVFYDEIAKAVARVDQAGAEYLVLLVDLDRFKPVNDLHGHTIGDVVLCEIAVRLKNVVRKGNIVTRLGGDEFGIVSEVNPVSESATDVANSLATRILTAVNRPIEVDGDRIEVGASIGIARCGRDGRDTETLLHAADVAMYQAKNDGGRGYRSFEKAMDVDARNQAALEGDFRRAVAEGQIEPYYQPLMALAENRLLGFEILARWRHPTLGAIEPEFFIPIAEKLGLISTVTFSLLATACREALRWPSEYVLSLNISPIQLTDRFLPVQILEVLSAAGFPPTRLEIEVTESALIADLAAARDIVSSFRNLGIKVSLDDFGTGYSSIYRLRELSFDKIKIDRSFVQSMLVDPDSARLVNAIIALTKSLGLQTTAEGIETSHAMASMVEKGCEFGQGSYFGEAIPGADVPALIAGKSAERNAAAG